MRASCWGLSRKKPAIGGIILRYKRRPNILIGIFSATPYKQKNHAGNLFSISAHGTIAAKSEFVFTV